MSNQYNNMDEYREKIKIDTMDWVLSVLAVVITIVIMGTFIYRIEFIVSYGFSVLYIIVALVMTFAFFKQQVRMLKALDEKHQEEGN